MDNSSKSIAQGLRRMFAAIVRRPMGWNLIDAFTRLEEREEAERPGDETNESEPSPTPPVIENPYKPKGP
jgi:hypothetical protein